MSSPNKAKIEDGWQIKYAKPPKKNEPKLKKMRLGGIPLGRLSSGGNKIWHISAPAQNISGIANKGRSSAFIKYIEREGECIATFGDEDAEQKFKELDGKLLEKRKTSVLQRRFVVPVPKEWLDNNPEKLLEKFGELAGERFFDKSYTWKMALHAGGPDYHNPHIHVAFANVDGNLKVIREYNSSDFLDKFEETIKEIIERELNIECTNRPGKEKATEHFPKWIAQAYKRAKTAEERGDGGAMIQEYIERYPIFEKYVLEKSRKKIEREIEGLEREINFPVKRNGTERTNYKNKSGKKSKNIEKHGKEEIKILEEHKANMEEFLKKQLSDAVRKRAEEKLKEINNKILQITGEQIGRTEIMAAAAISGKIVIRLEDIGTDEIMLARIRNIKNYFPTADVDKKLPSALVIEDTVQNRKDISAMLTDDLNLVTSFANKLKKREKEKSKENNEIER